MRKKRRLPKKLEEPNSALLAGTKEISDHIQVIHMRTQEASQQAPNESQGSDHFPVTATLRL